MLRRVQLIAELGVFAGGAGVASWLVSALLSTCGWWMVYSVRLDSPMGHTGVQPCPGLLPNLPDSSQDR